MFVYMCVCICVHMHVCTQRCMQWEHDHTALWSVSRSRLVRYGVCGQLVTWGRLVWTTVSEMWWLCDHKSWQSSYLELCSHWDCRLVPSCLVLNSTSSRTQFTNTP